MRGNEREFVLISPTSDVSPQLLSLVRSATDADMTWFKESTRPSGLPGTLVFIGKRKSNDGDRSSVTISKRDCASIVVFAPQPPVFVLRTLVVVSQSSARRCFISKENRASCESFK